jgi:hypothetical protein
MEKNTAGKWIVFAFEDESGANPGEPVTGDEANITANVRIDGGVANAIDDTNPTPLEGGYYIFDLTAAETNGDLLLIAPSSVTANVNVIGVPGACWTTPPNFPDLAITATDGRIDVGEWLGTAVTVSSTSNKPEVDMFSVSDGSTAADNMQQVYAGEFADNYNTTINRWEVDVSTWLGTAVQASTAGIPDVNTERINNTLLTGDGQPGTEFGV